MKSKTQKLVIASMFAAIICVVTMIIKVPLPMKGYLNLGDSILMVAAVVLPQWYAFAAAAVGSCLADVFAGYAIYAPATFAVKGIMALAMALVTKKNKGMATVVPGAVVAELIMTLGYFLYEMFVFSTEIAVVNIVPNLVQGVFSAVFGIAIIVIYQKRMEASALRHR